MNILALFAHPDDVEIACGGTLLKYREAGHSIFIALTTSGNTGSNETASLAETAAVREAEQLAAAKYFGARVRFLRFDDEGLTDTPETRRAVLTAIRWADPDVIFTHFPGDASPDHRVSAKLVTDVLLSVGGKLHPAALGPIQKAPQVFFCETGAGVGFHPRAYVDVTAQMPAKLAAFACHASQTAWLHAVQGGEEDIARGVEAVNRVRGLQSGFAYAEGFIAHRILGYSADYRVLPQESGW